jgi:PAS domain S-box-containing protein
MPTATARPKQPVLWLLLFAVVHFVLSLIAVELRTGLSEDALFWGLSGLTAAAVAQTPRPWRHAVVAAVVLSCGLVSLTMGVSAWTALGFAVANGAQALIAGDLLRRHLPQGRRIVRLREISWLAAAALAGGFVGAGLGALTQLATVGSLDPSVFGTWFMANIAGTLVGAPVFLALFSLRAEPPPMPQWVPTLIAGASTAIVVIVSIWASSETNRNFSYLVIVPVMVSAVWLGQRHTALLVGGLALSLAVATNRGIGPFAATESMFDPVMAAQLFMSVVQLTALTVGVEASRRRDVIAELDAILAATVEGVLVVDDTGTIRHTNAGAESILGSSERELIGMKLGPLVPGDVNDEESLHLTRAQRVDGSEFWAEISRGKIFEGSGRRRVAVVVRDVTGRIETEESVRRIQDEFVSNMTHELKTPLTAIIGFSDWMLSDPDTPNSAEDLETIRDSALSMQELIDDILDFKRISGADAAREPVDLADIIELSVAVVNPAAVDRSIEVALSVERCPAVMGDADQLQSAVQNLVSNAVKYSNPGGKVRVGLRREGGQALLSVEDEGIGIPDTDQEHLFERFFRAGNTGDIHGTGLGLALVRQVIERHHGSVALSSVVGEGTRVTVVLPVATGVETSRANARNEAVPEPAV